jgi:hypothetical protein
MTDFQIADHGSIIGLACLAGATATMFLPRDVWKRSP